MSDNISELSLEKNYMNTPLSWGDRFALIAYYAPTLDQILHTFNVSQVDYENANQLITEGIFKLTDIDPVKYGNIFEDEHFVLPSEHSFATRIKAKRGRKGDKITQAFASIPTVPTEAVEFAKLHGISIPVLRQSKRFDTTALIGKVIVKKLAIEGKDEKQLMIWREEEPTS